MDHFTGALAAVRALEPDIPLAMNRPHLVRAAARLFTRAFPGDILYAVKANPSPWVLEALWAEGVRMFDVASLNECALVRGLFPQATLAFMHPVKSRSAIARAYTEHGCRIFALDTLDELEKIEAATGGARDLTLVVRMAVSNSAAGLPLADKFGASGAQAVSLLQAVRQGARTMGVSFHVGSQCMDPSAWRRAMVQVGAAITAAGVMVDVVDVGGGFPSQYPGMTPPPVQAFIDEIERVFDAMLVPMTARLWAEPGRALVAEATSIVARVDLVKGDALYLNDGSYGNLFDATHVKWRYPVRLIRTEGTASTQLRAFRIYGPTCDSMDAAEGPFELPVDIREGDYVEFGMLGAYGTAMATRFNGYGETLEVTTGEMPWPSRYADTCTPTESGLRRAL
jgi:ornithine decarboxylase